MKVRQIYELVNTMTQEFIGESALVNEDLSNIVDVGKQILDSTDMDNFVKSLIDRIRRTIFVDEVYTSTAPRIAVEYGEYASILQKIRCELNDAVENKTWSLVEGESVDQYIFTPPTVSAKYFNSLTTFEVDISLVDRQLRSALTGPDEFIRFVAMIENRIRTTMEIKREALIMRTIVNLIAEKAKANTNMVNLLSLYKNYSPNGGTDTLTKENCLYDKEFLRFANMQIKLYSDRLTKASMLYNNDGYITFTPKNRQHLVLLSEYVSAAESYLYSDTFHDDFVKLGGTFDTVPFWQSTTYVNGLPFLRNSGISAICASDGKSLVKGNGIIGVLFDRRACAVSSYDQRVTSARNERGEYTNYFYKEDAAYLNDLAENCIVFTLSNPTVEEVANPTAVIGKAVTTI